MKKLGALKITASIILVSVSYTHLYVFYKKYSDQLNQKYLSEQFEKLGLTLFEMCIRDSSTLPLSSV